MATNFEYYKDKILEAVEHGGPLAVKDNKPVSCRGMKCNECDFESTYGECNPKRFRWLYAEHIEPPKLTKRERAFCEAVQMGWIARDADDRVHWYDVEPTKTAWEWQYNSGQLVNLNPFHIFDFVEWKDEKPWAVEDLLKLEVIEEVQEDA